MYYLLLVAHCNDVYALLVEFPIYNASAVPKRSERYGHITTEVEMGRCRRNRQNRYRIGVSTIGFRTSLFNQW